MTLRLYQNDTYLFEFDAILLSIEECLHPKYNTVTHKITLNQTIFHAQGGGQPSDKGELSINDTYKCQVIHVQSNNSNIIEHYVVFNENIDNIDKLINSNVQMKIDINTRMNATKLHSAGHLVDVAFIKLDLLDNNNNNNNNNNNIKYKDKIIPTKGYHFNDGAYVEYELQNSYTLSKQEMEELPSKLTSILTELIEEDIPTVIESLNIEAAKEICDIDSNINDIIRIVYIGNHPIPCGGTHIKSTKELKGLRVTKVKTKKTTVKVSYELFN